MQVELQVKRFVCPVVILQLAQPVEQFDGQEVNAPVVPLQAQAVPEAQAVVKVQLQVAEHGDPAEAAFGATNEVINGSEITAAKPAFLIISRLVCPL